MTILIMFFSSLLINPINASGYCLLRDGLRQEVAANSARDTAKFWMLCYRR